jgi:hypothetical protein
LEPPWRAAVTLPRDVLASRFARRTLGAERLGEGGCGWVRWF